MSRKRKILIGASLVAGVTLTLGLANCGSIIIRYRLWQADSALSDDAKLAAASLWRLSTPWDVSEVNWIILDLKGFEIMECGRLTSTRAIVRLYFPDESLLRDVLLIESKGVWFGDKVILVKSLG